jgi:catechol 2,3-dioxygenase
MSSANLLPAATSMGAVTLWVAELDSMVRFYRDGVGLDLISHQGDRAILGQHHPKRAREIVILEAKNQMRHASPGQAGLFHTAILFDTEISLARAVQSVASQYPSSFTGSADHLVSKAFYFNDPENNGVELYWDRDRSEWSWVHGSVQMDTIYLDPNQYLKEHLTPSSQSALNQSNKQVGHVHLSVGSIDAAEEFYVKILGFEKTFNWGNQALFVSAGGYHHHMAMNTWRSKGAGKRQLTLGLAKVEIALDSQDEIDETRDRLTFHGEESQSIDDRTIFQDPWGNSIQLSLK